MTMPYHPASRRESAALVSTGDILPSPFDNHTQPYQGSVGATMNGLSASQPQQHAMAAHSPTNTHMEHYTTHTKSQSGTNCMPTATPQYPLPSPTPTHQGGLHDQRPLPGYGQQIQQPLMAPPGHYRYTYHMPQLPGQLMPNMPHAPPHMSYQLSGNVPINPNGMAMSHHQAPVNNPPQDRPFKCDVCVQSFSRNHDLKRHKRIHLAVKPFPCNYCNKQFSRKDALKRHRLVKGCEEKYRQEMREKEEPEDDSGLLAPKREPEVWEPKREPEA